MALIEEYRKSGNFLFRYRSFFPWLFIISGIIVLYLTRTKDSVSTPVWMEFLFLAIGMIGQLIRIITVGYAAPFTSGRNRHFQRADSLNTKGIYSLVRHPLYLANFMMWLSLALFIQNIWFLIVFGLIYWLYYERIMFAEEYFLRRKYGKEYLKWSLKTPPFFPHFKNYQKPEFPFNYKKIFRAEMNGYISLIGIFTILNITENYFLSNHFTIDKAWLIIFSVSIVLFLIIKTIQKTTTIFNDPIEDPNEEHYEELIRRRNKM